MVVCPPLVPVVTEQGLDPAPDHLDCAVIRVMDGGGWGHPRHRHNLQPHQGHQEEVAHAHCLEPEAEDHND